MPSAVTRRIRESIAAASRRARRSRRAGRGRCLGVGGLGEPAHDDEAAGAGGDHGRRRCSGVTPPVTNHGPGGVRGGVGARSSRPVPGPAGLGRRGVDRSGRDVVDGLAGGGVELGRGVGREADDGVGAEDAAGQRRRGVVLADVHAVGPDLEGEVGPVVEDERHAEVAAHPQRQPGPGRASGRASSSLSRSCTMSTPPRMQAARKRLEVGPVGRAEVEAAAVEPRPRQPPATARTSSSRSPSASTVVGRGRGARPARRCARPAPTWPRGPSGVEQVGRPCAPSGSSTGSPLLTTVHGTPWLSRPCPCPAAFCAFLKARTSSSASGDVDVGHRAAHVVGERARPPPPSPAGATPSRLAEQGQEDPGLLVAEAGQRLEPLAAARRRSAASAHTALGLAVVARRRARWHSSWARLAIDPGKRCSAGGPVKTAVELVGVHGGDGGWRRARRRAAPAAGPARRRPTPSAPAGRAACRSGGPAGPSASSPSASGSPVMKKRRRGHGVRPLRRTAVGIERLGVDARSGRWRSATAVGLDLALGGQRVRARRRRRGRRRSRSGGAAPRGCRCGRSRRCRATSNVPGTQRAIWSGTAFMKSVTATNGPSASASALGDARRARRLRRVQAVPALGRRAPPRAAPCTTWPTRARRRRRSARPARRCASTAALPRRPGEQDRRPLRRLARAPARSGRGPRSDRRASTPSGIAGIGVVLVVEGEVVEDVLVRRRTCAGMPSWTIAATS